MENDSVFVGRRDRSPKDKQSQKRDAFVAGIGALLDEIQAALFARAKKFRDDNTVDIKDKAAFKGFFGAAENNKGKLTGGFASTGFCCDPELEDQIAKQYKVSARCIPNETKDETPKCVFTGKLGKRVIFARSY